MSSLLFSSEIENLMTLSRNMNLIESEHFQTVKPVIEVNNQHDRTVLQPLISHTCLGPDSHTCGGKEEDDRTRLQESSNGATAPIFKHPEGYFLLVFACFTFFNGL
jgi:hypothetical protein